MDGGVRDLRVGEWETHLRMQRGAMAEQAPAAVVRAGGKERDNKAAGRAGRRARAAIPVERAWQGEARGVGVFSGDT